MSAEKKMAEATTAMAAAMTELQKALLRVAAKKKVKVSNDKPN
jgi:hypothetical protein